MRIIRPYGESKVDHKATDSMRYLVRNTSDRAREDIIEFAVSHDELVIAQWISAIDKIATKPSGKDGATTRQRDFRERLGAAVWQVIKRERCLPGLDNERDEYLRKLWAYKIHPYGKRTFRPKGRQGEPRPDARSFRRFTDAARPEDASVDAIADQIYEHLYKGELRARQDLPSQPMGRIKRRAESIRKNHLGRRLVSREWNDADECTYANFDVDVAKEIRTEAMAREQGADGASTERVTLDVAGSALYDHWARIFRDGDQVLSMTEAQQRSPGLVALHKAVKDAYARILKRHRKDRPEHNKGRPRQPQRRVSDLLPRDMDGLYQLMGHQRKNRTLGDLVRLGKVIHYSASIQPDGEILWPLSVERSRYWSSDGQAEIKRSEAFVRTWRNALALASRTLKGWADPNNQDNGDIVQAANLIGNRISIDPDQFDLKLDLLFGKRKKLILRGLSTRAEVLKQTISDTYDLRNRVYHFKGRHSFLAGLHSLGQGGDPSLAQIDRELWNADCEGQHGVYLDALEGAHLNFFATKLEAAHLANAIVDADDGTLAMPRFNRVVTRAKQAWGKEKEKKPNLPNPANRLDLQAPSRHFQYVAVKMLYERSFRPWLEKQGSSALRQWIDLAIRRSTRAAKSLNARTDDAAYEMIASRAEGLPRPVEGARLADFFYDLTSATASEMRVQRGYQSDAEAARKQAAYIEDLKCDVVALAFSDYLASDGFAWLQTFDLSFDKPTIPAFEMSELEVSPPKTNAEPWQRRLYYLLHLIPVDEVGRLLHQLARFERTTFEDDSYTDDEKTLLTGLRRAMVLYLDMHDAKFEGGVALAGFDEFQDLFQDPATFNAVFPKGEADPDSRVPRRGLREIARFGNLATIEHWFDAAPITMTEVASATAFEEASDGKKSKIALLQAEREDLHRQWTEAKRGGGLPSRKVQRYIDLIRQISEHRRISNRVNLIDHLRAHRLLLTVAGRLIDYVGLFERDLFFVVLAICHDLGLTPKDVFTSDGYKYLQNGQTLFAIQSERRRRPNFQQHERRVHDRIKEHFTNVYDTANRIRGTRNHIAHLNMFGNQSAQPRDWTSFINDVRQMVAYDRKLKNAVSQSIKELLIREGFELSWQIGKNGGEHKLCNAEIQIRTATHLGGLRLTERTTLPGKKGPMKHTIREAIHSPELVAVVAKMFAGRAGRVHDISTLPLGQIDFNAIDRDMERRKQRKGNHGKQRRPYGGKDPRRRKKNPNKVQ